MTGPGSTLPRARPPRTGLAPAGGVEAPRPSWYVTVVPMPSWISRLFRTRRPPPALPPPDTALAEAEARAARAQARLALRLDELERKVEGGFADLRALLKEVATRPATPASLRWDDLLDALDRIEDAGRAVDRAAAPGFAEGLDAVIEKLERFLAQAGMARRSTRGVPPDGRLFRVVGTEPTAEVPVGTIARVVRAAVLAGERVVREGEVIVRSS